MTDDCRPAPRRHAARALLSVSDKAGLADLARALAARGVLLVSTGATARTLRDGGLAVTEVAEVTGHPEMLGGRVKTLHPRIHGGLLARRGDPGHEAELRAHGVAPFDLLVVNLYPFEAAVARGAPWEETVEEIDVGGPAMIRAGAKNHASVAVLTDPGDYPALLAELDAGGTTLAFRRRMAGKAFVRMAAYDAAIASHFEDTGGEVAPRTPPAGALIRTLRYGENPHQRAAFYRAGPERAGVATATQVGGKELGLNNIADADAAFELVAELAAPACAIVKHANPCGVGTGATLALAHARALACDPVSAFGGVVAVNRPLDEAAAQAITAVFTEVVIAPDADEAARAVLAQKPNLRLLLTGALPNPTGPGAVVHSVAGGLLVQDRDAGSLDKAALAVATARAPTDAEMADLRLAWIVAKHARSNAIALVADGATVGVGAGQMSRVDAVRQAVAKLREHNAGASPVMASDAFFPFADGLEAAAEAGVTAVIQPGGSQRDAEVIAAADRAGLAMVLTAMRHFRH